MIGGIERTCDPWALNGFGIGKECLRRAPKLGGAEACAGHASSALSLPRSGGLARGPELQPLAIRTYAILAKENFVMRIELLFGSSGLGQRR